ncbi:MAG: YbaN family protein [Planctomycetota bacterium]
MDLEPLEAPSPRLARGPWRVVLLAAGLVSTTLALVGAFLPVLPTTPFLLLAGACFARSSARFHRKLLENRAFGPYVRQWQADRSVPRSAKRKAYGLVVATFALSIAVVDHTELRVMLASLGTVLVVFLWWLPTTEDRRPGAPDDESPTA